LYTARRSARRWWPPASEAEVIEAGGADDGRGNHARVQFSPDPPIGPVGRRETGAAAWVTGAWVGSRA
jgi:hypothetical protein